jgi:hypothetical protein
MLQQQTKKELRTITAKIRMNLTFLPLNKLITNDKHYQMNRGISALKKQSYYYTTNVYRPTTIGGCKHNTQL